MEGLWKWGEGETKGKRKRKKKTRIGEKGVLVLWSGLCGGAVAEMEKMEGLGSAERRLLIYGRLKRETENSSRPKQSFLSFG